MAEVEEDSDVEVTSWTFPLAIQKEPFYKRDKIFITRGVFQTPLQFYDTYAIPIPFKLTITSFRMLHNNPP